MLTRRLIVCLDVKGGRVVKGMQFVELRDVGDPVALAERYEARGRRRDHVPRHLGERRGARDAARRRAAHGGAAVRAAHDRRRRAHGRRRRARAARRRRQGVAQLGGGGAPGGASPRRGALRRAVRGGEHRREAAMTPEVWRVWVKGGREATPLEAVAWARECVRAAPARSCSRHRSRRRAHRLRPRAHARRGRRGGRAGDRVRRRGDRATSGRCDTRRATPTRRSSPASCTTA